MENQEINLAVAAIAGRTDNYVESIDAIAKVFDLLGFEWSVTSDCYAFVTSQNELIAESNGETPAIALCNLLLEINPTPIKPVQKAEVLEAVF